MLTKGQQMLSGILGVSKLSVIVLRGCTILSRDCIPIKHISIICMDNRLSHQRFGVHIMAEFPLGGHNPLGSILLGMVITLISIWNIEGYVSESHGTVWSLHGFCCDCIKHCVILWKMIQVLAWEHRDCTGEANRPQAAGYEQCRYFLS